MAKWKLTVREGPKVERRSFGELDDALAAARETAEGILSTAPLRTVKAIRDYEPDHLTKARIELTGKGLLRPPTAGLDIRGDNTAIGYTGAVRRKPLKAEGVGAIFKAIRQALQHE